MAEPADDQMFRRHAKVAAAVDLEGVPAGSPGKVMYVAGFSWRRCRVRFDNGVERGGLDRRHLVGLDEWREREHAAAVAEARATQERLAEEYRATLRPGGAH